MKIRYLIFSSAAFAACAGLYFFTRPPPPSAAPPAPSATVSAVTLRQQTVLMQVDAAGTVIAGVAQTDITLAAPGIVAGFSVQPGQAVAKNQTLADILPDPQSIAALRKAQSAADAAAAARDHVVALLSQHLATQADLAAATQTLQGAQADLAALRAAGTGQKRRIQAPFDGTIIAIPAIAGSLLQAGTPVLQLAATAALNIRAGFTQADAAQIQSGDPATVTLLNTGATLAATVLQRGAMLDAQTGLIDVTLLPHGLVLLGEPVAVQITSGCVTGDVVPRDAVLSDDQGDYVYLLDGKNIAHRKNVQVLESADGNIVLAPNLDPAMRLATIGAYQLSDGMTATLQDAAP
jgi:RND family efflux transporter MFP subunit